MPLASLPAADSPGRSSTMRIYKQTQEMLAVEEYPIYYKADFYCPHVDLEVEEEMVPFVIDTGSIYSLISLKLVEDWGWREEIMPIEEDENEIGCIGLILKIKGILFTDMFLVVDRDYNILGTRALSHFNCIIDLDAQKLTLREFDCQAWEKQELDTVRVEGQDVNALADTGFEGFLQGRMEMAERLKLPLEDISSHTHFTVIGLEEIYVIKYEAFGVRVSAYGREGRGDFQVTPRDMGDAEVLLGIEFLKGAVIRCEKGTQSITFPEKSETETPVRAL